MDVSGLFRKAEREIKANGYTDEVRSLFLSLREERQFEELSGDQLSLLYDFYRNRDDYPTATRILFVIHRKDDWYPYYREYIESIGEVKGLDILELMKDPSNFTLVLNTLTEHWNESKARLRSLLEEYGTSKDEGKEEGED